MTNLSRQCQADGDIDTPGLEMAPAEPLAAPRRTAWVPAANNSMKISQRPKQEILRSLRAASLKINGLPAELSLWRSADPEFCTLYLRRRSERSPSYGLAQGGGEKGACAGRGPSSVGIVASASSRRQNSEVWEVAEIGVGSAMP